MDALDFILSWKGDKFDTIILDPPYCYDNETEVLTDDGWKFFKDLDEGEKIATLNPSTGYLEYQKPIQYINQYYKGKMVKIKSGYVNLLVTPNHELYIRKNWKTNDFKLVKAVDVNFGCNFKTVCKWDGIEQQYFTLPEVVFNGHDRYGNTKADEKQIKMDNWLRFFGIWLAEGSVDRKGTSYRIRIAQKRRKIDF